MVLDAFSSRVINEILRTLWLETPIPCRGDVGMWNMDDELALRV